MSGPNWQMRQWSLPYCIGADSFHSNNYAFEDNKNKMSQNLDRYWQIEYQLQQLWNEPHEVRDYSLISVLNAEQSSILDTLREDERRQFEDAALTNH